ncbi:hypothetical protein EJB05_15370, partial [Eragrostis curvula]
MTSLVAARSICARSPAVAFTPRRRTVAVNGKGPERANLQSCAYFLQPDVELAPSEGDSLDLSEPGSGAHHPDTEAHALAFRGPPRRERINGRLAMVSFESAIAVEASHGDSQGGSVSGLALFAATAAVLSVASLVPLLQGDSAEARSGSFMSADAELWNWNGRFAMLGLVALAFAEYLTGSLFIKTIRTCGA